MNWTHVRNLVGYERYDTEGPSPRSTPWNQRWPERLGGGSAAAAQLQEGKRRDRPVLLARERHVELASSKTPLLKSNRTPAS